ncbi:MAG TPA: efflux RND transporter periplasmic adaptor subunit [Planctomycetota bacterium]|nr:efflux RND transporter periplasmic adaptor subunit [Planctomycetota bacterium]
MKKLIVWFLVVIIVAGIGWLIYTRYGDMKKRKAKNDNDEKIVSVSVQQVGKTDLLETMPFFGTVKAINQVDIYTKISGRVEELNIKNGDEVKSGDILVVLEHSAVKAQAEQATASLEAAGAQLKQLQINLVNLKKELDRIIELSKEGAVSESKKDQIETQYNALLAQKEAVEAQMKQLEAVQQQAKINLAEANIRASISGIVSQKYVDMGDMVTPQRPVFTIIQVDTVKVTASIPEMVLSRVKTGLTHAVIAVDAYPDKKFDGIVTYVAPSVDQRSRTLEIEIELSNRDKILKAGMFCRVELILDNKKGIIAIPKDLIVYDVSGGKQEYAIYTIQDGLAKKVNVNIGIYSHGLVEIKDGLAAGDTIITSVGPHIFDGCKVSPVRNDTIGNDKE